MKFYSLFKWVALVCAIISVISFAIAVLRYFDNKPGDDAMEAYISTLQQSINSYEEDINTYNVKIDSLSKVQTDIKKYYENKIVAIKNASVASNIAIISEDSININPLPDNDSLYTIDSIAIANVALLSNERTYFKLSFENCTSQSLVKDTIITNMRGIINTERDINTYIQKNYDQVLKSKNRWKSATYITGTVAGLTSIGLIISLLVK